MVASHAECSLLDLVFFILCLFSHFVAVTFEIKFHAINVWKNVYLLAFMSSWIYHWSCCVLSRLVLYAGAYAIWLLSATRLPWVLPFEANHLYLASIHWLPLDSTDQLPYKMAASAAKDMGVEPPVSITLLKTFICLIIISSVRRPSVGPRIQVSSQF